MREIKFRAWDIVLKKMYYPQEIKSWIIKDGKWELFYKNGNFAPRHIMQYTGLKDKNGKEIYEGDILADVGVDEYTVLGTVLYSDDGVAWTSGSYYLADEKGYATDWAFEDGGKPDSWSALEVIGNIYENPESMS